MTHILTKFLAPPACLENCRISGCMCQLWHLICLTCSAFERVCWRCEVAYGAAIRLFGRTLKLCTHIHQQSVVLLDTKCNAK